MGNLCKILSIMLLVQCNALLDFLSFMKPNQKPQNTKPLLPQWTMNILTFLFRFNNQEVCLVQTPDNKYCLILGEYNLLCNNPGMICFASEELSQITGKLIQQNIGTNIFSKVVAYGNWYGLIWLILTGPGTIQVQYWPLLDGSLIYSYLYSVINSQKVENKGAELDFIAVLTFLWEEIKKNNLLLKPKFDWVISLIAYSSNPYFVSKIFSGINNIALREMKTYIQNIINTLPAYTDPKDLMNNTAIINDLLNRLL
jgi:hypothetical protein